MNKEQQQLIDEVYDIYFDTIRDDSVDWLDEKQFIDKVKTDEFTSVLWGLKIEERELNHDERINLCLQLRPETKFAAHYETNETLMNDWNIPTRLITVTRELSESEIWEYIHKNKIEILHQHAVLYAHEFGSEYRKSFIPTLKENYNIPTNKTIESYE
jgi:hypothetical protein